MKILFSGGGTLGPVTPLLAMKEQMAKAHPDAQFLWVGTKRGPERALVESYHIPFTTLSSGKFRRYLTIWNIVDIFRIIIGFFQSIGLLLREKPSVCISAGGFISVPLHVAAWFLRIPTWIHQQDVTVGLANKIMAPFARTITTALEINSYTFKKKKAQWIGNPVRQEILQGSKARAKELFGLRDDLPVVLATGGGTGSIRVNQMIVGAMQKIHDKCQIIHLTGAQRPQALAANAAKQFDTYHVYQFLTSEMADAYAVADVVVSRGGFGTMSELAALGKPAIFIPKGGHQQDNVRLLVDAGAAMMLDGRTSDGQHLAKMITEILSDKTKKQRLSYQLRQTLPRASKEDILAMLHRTVNK